MVILSRLLDTRVQSQRKILDWKNNLQVGGFEGNGLDVFSAVITGQPERCEESVLETDPWSRTRSSSQRGGRASGEDVSRKPDQEWFLKDVMIGYITCYWLVKEDRNFKPEFTVWTSLFVFVESTLEY